MNLDQNRIGNMAMFAFWKNFPSNRSIERITFNLGANKIDEKGFDSICEGLYKSRQVKQVVLSVAGANTEFKKLVGLSNLIENPMKSMEYLEVDLSGSKIND